jgi:hypothetical protein
VDATGVALSDLVCLHFLNVASYEAIMGTPAAIASGATTQHVVSMAQWTETTKHQMMELHVFHNLVRGEEVVEVLMVAAWHYLHLALREIRFSCSFGEYTVVFPCFCS